MNAVDFLQGVSDTGKRGNAPLRSLAFLFQRWILHRPYLIADIPGLGLRFKVRTCDRNGRHLYKYRRHESDLTRYLCRNLRLERGDVVIDIGANMGWYSLLVERLAPAHVDIFAFEPDPDNFALLTENLSLNGSAMITPVQQALAETAGESKLYRYKDANLGRHSLLPINDGEAVSVATASLDEFWQARGLGNRVPRFIKIDVEGYELIALRGARDVLARCPLVLAEYSPTYMRAGGIRPGDLVELLTTLGLAPFEVRGGELQPVDSRTLPDSDRHRDLFWTRPGG